MKHPALALVIAALAAPLFPRPAAAQVEVTFDYFQNELAPFGEWIDVAGYGLCWRPTGVAADWAPYTDGYWAYTDAGWTWVSYEDWGAITYHYGRWVHLLDEGWVWVPDYDWGPAWVSWRANDDYIGWAPLPPEARWEESTGFSTWVDTSYDIGPDSYRFCHTYDFGAPVLAPVCLPYEQNITIIQSTVNITNICYRRESTLIFCGGPHFENINRHCRRPIPALKLVCEDRAPRGSHGHAPAQVLRGNQLAVFAPKVRRPVDLKALPITPRRMIGAEKITRGWSRVPEGATREDLRKKLGGQTAGLTPATAPARPVKIEELRGIPVKADPRAPSPNAVLGNRGGRPVESIAARTQTPSAPAQPPRPDTAPMLPRAVTNRDTPPVKVPQVAPPAAPRVERSVPAQPFINRPVERTERPARVEAAPVRVQPAPPSPQPDEDQARRTAEAARQQQQVEAAQRANELRARQTQRIEAVRQQQEARRVNEARNQQMQDQAQRANEARQQHAQQQQAAARANELRSQQAGQQRQQAREANAARQQQEAARHAAESRNREAQQQRQNEAAQRANEMRNQQAREIAAAQRQQQQQQIAAQRASEMRQQRAAPPEPRRVQEAPPPPRQMQAPPQPSRPSRDDGEKKEKREK